MTTTAQKDQAAAALAELEAFLPAVRKTFYIARTFGGGHFGNAFPAIAHGEPGYIPGQSGDLSPPVTDAIFARIEAGIAVAKAIVNEAVAS